MTEEVKLLPCPFCGGMPERDWIDNDRPFAIVSCATCPALVEVHGGHWQRAYLEEEAVTAWNTRIAAEQTLNGELVRKAESAEGWFKRAFDAERRLLEAGEALSKIATGQIAGEPGNARDTLAICRNIATEALAALKAPIAEKGGEE